MTSSRINNLPKLLQRGLQHLQAGQLQQAEQIYHQVLAQQPNHAEANHFLGIIACQLGQFEIGAGFIRQAITAKPRYAEAYKSLGKVLQETGELQEAATNFRQALALRPNYPEALNDLGNTLNDLEQFDEAIACFKKAIGLRPDFFIAYNNLGNVLQEQDKLDEAIACFKKAIGLQPGLALFHYNLGNALKKKELYPEAINSYEKALTIQPNYPEAILNISLTLKKRGNIPDAAAYCRKVLALKPDHIDAHIILAGYLKELGSLSEAVRSYHNALYYNSENANVLNGLGNILLLMGHLSDAVDCFRKSLTLKPENATLHQSILFALNYFPNISQAEIYEESRHWDDHHAKDLLKVGRPRENAPDKARKLRIGYVSSDFRDHSVAYFFEPVLNAHNRDNIEVFCYANVKEPDNVTQRFQEAADHWVPIAEWIDDEITDRIKEDQIDILVDLAAHTSGSNLLVFARKPAPIQVTWLGFPNTTGMQAMDYRLTDVAADPAGESDELHSEQLVRLEHGFLCYQAEASAPPVSESPCLANGYVTFGSFNNLPKINQAVVKLWSKILSTLPGSRLLLKSKQLTDQETRTRYQAMFAEQGIETERLEFHGMLPNREDHLGLYSRVDIGLDPFPYNGTTTTCEALWMGVPVLTIAGDRHAGRVGASIMQHVGLSEFVTGSVEQYIDLAQSLAADQQRLTELRTGLRQQMQQSELMDSQLFTRTLEDAYRQMWIKWCEERA